MAECSDNIVSNSVNVQNQGCAPTDSPDDGKTEKAMVTEMFLIQDTQDDKLPKAMENILNSLRKEFGVFDKNDLLVLILYVLMLETGFIPKSERGNVERMPCFHYKRVLKLTTSLPRGFKIDHNMYKIEFILPPFPLYVCTLLCSLNAGDLIVNGYIRNIQGVNYSMLLDASQYLISSTTEISVRFQHLDILSKKFKDTMANHLRTDILRVNNHDGYALEDLPFEVIVEIAKYLPLTELIRLSSTGKRMYSTLKDSQVIEKTIDKNMRKERNKGRLQRLLKLREK